MTINGKTPVAHGRNVIWIDDREIHKTDWTKLALIAASIVWWLLAGWIAAWVLDDTFTELNYHDQQHCYATGC